MDRSAQTGAPEVSGRERRRRAEAVRHHRDDARVRALARSDELALLRTELQTATRLTLHLGELEDVTEMAELVVADLQATFAHYLVAIQRLGDDGVLRVIASRGELAEVMSEFLIVEQAVAEGVNGRVARTRQTALVEDTRLDPDYMVRDEQTDPRSELSVPVLCDGELWGVLNIEELEAGALTETYAVLVEGIVASLGAALYRAKLIAELRQSFTTTLAALTTAVETKDDATALHGLDVSELAERLARRLGLGPREAADVRLAAMLHDVGKIAIPSEILLKPGKLTDAEWDTMRTHASIGGELVARIDAFAHLAPMVRHHHERIDGGGYPDGLSEDRIPLGARIIAACDSFDAITTDRPYRAARSAGEAVVELMRVSGTQLDPDVVGALVDELEGPGDDAATDSGANEAGLRRAA